MSVNFALWFLLAIALLLCEAAGLFIVPGLVWFLWWLPIIIVVLIFALLVGAATSKRRY